MHTLTKKNITKYFLNIILIFILSYTNLPKTQAAEPNLTEILNTLGFTNITETTTETFTPGTYNITLYAEFAQYYNENELSYYEIDTTNYTLLFSGPEGGSGYITPPITKTFTTNTTFGISMLTPEGHRYYTQQHLNPDGKNHSKIYINQDNHRMYLIGFENLYDAGDRDYQDFVFSLQKTRSNIKPDFTYSPSSPKTSENITFDASSSIGNITTYYWNFDDGENTAETDPTTTHVYESAGTYNVTLTVTDNEGYTDTIWRLITVESSIIHDISILNVTTNTPHEYPGRIVNITVVVKNNGEVPETFYLTVYRDTIPIETAPVNNLEPQENITIIFQWNTTGLTPCHNWSISANAPLLGDINPSDNTLADGYVKIKMLGDANADGVVDILDIVTASHAYHSRKGDPNWNPQADIAPEYGYVDVFDLVTIVYYYGKTCP